MGAQGTRPEGLPRHTCVSRNLNPFVCGAEALIRAVDAIFPVASALRNLLDTDGGRPRARPEAGERCCAPFEVVNSAGSGTGVAPGGSACVCAPLVLRLA